jgi:hypothetical protein
LTAECTASLPTNLVPGIDVDHPVHADIRNQEGDVVARFTAHWRVGLVQSSQEVSAPVS